MLNGAVSSSVTAVALLISVRDPPVVLTITLLSDHCPLKLSNSSLDDTDICRRISDNYV
jgi:hypothetical protein